jgi:DNA polymerase elongation subunit (family B)
MPPQADGREWTFQEEQEYIEAIAATMPAGIHVEHDGRYRAMYSYLEKNYALLDYETDAVAGYRKRDPVRLVGVAFRSSKTEPFIQKFIADALTLILRGEYLAVRDLFRDTCARLRAREVPTIDLCVTVPLTKLPQTYAAAQRKEEQYEVWLAAGNTTWKPGQRILYYQTKRGKRLLGEGPADYDPDFYINRLRTTAWQRLEKAFKPEDLDSLLSESAGLFEALLGPIEPLRVTQRAPIVADTPEAEEEVPPDLEIPEVA